MKDYRRRDVALAAGLSGVAGYIDAIGFLKLGGFFVSFMSGNSTRLGVGIATGQWTMVRTALTLIGLFVAGVPMFLLMGTGVAGAIVGFAVLGLLYVPQLATISATFPAMFPTQVRFAGFAIAYNLSTSIFGGTAPAVNDWL
ncbi:MAG TPA: DUF1275 family protein, partial [Caulobacter sp.]|nr:DUF1275 family protein [Caulobacter sp.]